MDFFTTFEWIEAVGWLASALTVATYSMNTMMPLRILAIGSSLCFAIYAAVLQVWPLLGMELILLPINFYRYWQLVTLRKKVGQSRGQPESDFSVVRTYGKSKTVKAGTVIFSQGDPVDSLYLLESGQVLIEEPGVTLEAGDIFGEMAFFMDRPERTATARCTQDSQVYELDEKRFMRLQFEDPSFGLSIMRLITRRLVAKTEPG